MTSIVVEANVVFRQSGAGAVDRDLEDKVREIEVSILDFGAVADSTGWDEAAGTLVTDNAAAINDAVAEVHARGGGTVRIPAVAGTGKFFGIGQPIIARPRVNIVGDGPAASRIRNCYDGPDVWRRGAFLLGNLHPAFLQTPGFGGADPTHATYYQMARPTLRSRQFTLAAPADADKFAAGDQLAIVSKTKGMTDIYQLSEHMILCNVTATSGAVVQVDEDIDIPDECEVAILADNKWRGIPFGTSSWYPDDCLFFFTGTIRDLAVRAASFAAIDSALLRVAIENVDYEGVYPLAYFNAAQRILVRNCRTTFHNVAGELSQNSYRVRLEGNEMTYKAVAGQEPGDATLSLGSEYGRDIEMDGTNRIDFGALGAPKGAAVIRVSGAQNIVAGPELTGTGALDPVSIVGLFSSGASPTFPVHGHRIGASGSLGSVGRAVSISGGGSPDFHDNLVDGLNVVPAAFSLPDTLAISGIAAAGNGVRNSRIAGGFLRKSESPASLVIRDSYIHEGYETIANAIGDDVRGLRERYSAAKRAMNFELFKAATAAANQTTTIYNRPLPRFRAGDRIEFMFVGAPSGTTAAKTFRLALFDDAASPPAAVSTWPAAFTKTQPATDKTNTSLEAVIACFEPNPILAFRVSYNGAAPTVSTVSPPASKGYSLRLLCTSAGAGTTVVFTMVSARISHPVYDYSN